MPEGITDDQAVDSSATEDATPEDSSTTESQDAQAAESSTADGANEPTALDIVEKALGAEESPPSEDDGGEATPKESEPNKDEVKADLPDDPTEEELKDAPLTTKRRVESLLSQRQDLRTEVDSLKPQAEQWQHIEQFREAQGLKPEYVANAIQIAALIENEPEKAFEVVTKLHTMLSEKVGATLPGDLRESVKRGEITQDRAFDLSKAQAKSNVLQQQRANDLQRQEQSAEAVQLQEQTRVAAETSTKWDQTKAASDPDWQLKRGEVAKRVELRLRAEGIPETAKAMQAVLDEEAKSLEAFAGQFRSAGRSIQPTPSSASPRAAAPRVPRDHYEVVDIALGE